MQTCKRRNSSLTIDTDHAVAGSPKWAELVFKWWDKIIYLLSHWWCFATHWPALFKGPFWSTPLFNVNKDVTIHTNLFLKTLLQFWVERLSKNLILVPMEEHSRLGLGHSCSWSLAFFQLRNFGRPSSIPPLYSTGKSIWTEARFYASPGTLGGQ